MYVGIVLRSWFRAHIVASDSCRIGFVRIKALGEETFGSKFGFGDSHITIFPRYNLHSDGSHHGLSSVFVGACLTMIEDVPLVANLTDAAMRVAEGCCGGNGGAIGTMFLSTTIDDSASVGPRTKRTVAIAIGQRVVATGQTIFSIIGHTTINEDVLVLDLAH